MKFPYFISFRYLFTIRKKKNLVNIISYISLFGIFISSASLVLVLSVFNGFENLVLNMYNAFDPHLKVTYKHDKFFEPDYVNNILSLNPNISSSSDVFEEKVLLQHNNQNIIATLKGVDENYNSTIDIDSVIYFGRYFSKKDFDDNSSSPIILGLGIAESLSSGIFQSIYVDSPTMVTVSLPDPKKKYLLRKSDIITKKFAPIGFFSVQSEYDYEFILCPIIEAQSILQKTGLVSSIEIKLINHKDMKNVKQMIQSEIGSDYIVQTRLEQHDFLYKLLNSEKISVFLILTFILILSSFNIVSTLSMLILDKKRDIQTIFNLGSSLFQIRKIFFIYGFFSVLIGSVFGVSIGLIISVLQENFQFISMEGNFHIDYYPIQIKFTDIIFVFIAVFFIGLLASYYPVRALSKKFVVK